VTLFIPTAFTPNDDGSNDVFRINSGSIQTANIQIYNRWGEKVFETDDARSGWDGTYKGLLCQTDYFVYLIKYKGKKTPWRYVRGYFYLIR
jgi:gliding motility-associated-like protein